MKYMWHKWLGKTCFCIHSEEKPFLYNECEKTFKTQQGLITHTQYTHDGIRPFACDKCPKKFFKSDKLKMHNQRMHELKKETCPHCGKLYSQLKEHLQRIHSDKKW